MAFCEVETDQGLVAWFSAVVLVGHFLGYVVQLGAHRRVWLSKTTESHCPKFKVDFFPSQVKIIGSAMPELLVVRQPCQPLNLETALLIIC